MEENIRVKVNFYNENIDLSINPDYDSFLQKIIDILKISPYQLNSFTLNYIDEEGVVRKKGELSSTYSLFRLGVPFNVSYRIIVGNKVIIAPYAGFTWHFNPLNDITTELEYTEKYKKTPEYASVSQYAPEYKHKLYNHHEIQASCQVGFKLTINKHILLGAEYCLGITDIADDTKSTHAAVNVGYEW